MTRAELKKFWPWKFVCFQNSIFQSFINWQNRKFCKIRRNFIKTSPKLISVSHLSFTLEISICFDMFEWLILVKSLETLTFKWFMNGRLIQKCLSKIIMSRCSIKFHASKKTILISVTDFAGFVTNITWVTHFQPCYFDPVN